ncbi:MAG TPA: type II toxin-antitoxin system VapC family toxin [Solirubrobacterales bacterium]|nr:type II toxin-antitoxin system VapC family toxin [Solirubrobacterales bacterium]
MADPDPARGIVVDASAIVDLLCGTELAEAVQQRLSDERLLAPAHIDAEVLSALGRLQRAGRVTEPEVEERLELLAGAPLERRPLAPLLSGAWERRHNLRLVDALYVELASQLEDSPLITTDSGMASAHASAELIGD